MHRQRPTFVQALNQSKLYSVLRAGPLKPFHRTSAVSGAVRVISPTKRSLLVGVGLGLAVVLLPRSFSVGPSAQQSPPSTPRPTQHSSRGWRRRAAAMWDQDRLVEYLKDEGVVKSPEVERALRATDRGAYIAADMPKMFAYHDSPLPIGYGETISAPHMHATCLELLKDHLRPGARVLDVGSGSGYLAAAMAEMVGEQGRVIGIEKHPELAQISKDHVRQAAPHLLDSGVLELRAGNVLGSVLEAEEPFDAIHVGAAASKLPDVLVRKMKPGARMVIPVGQQWDYQVMQCIDKDMQGHIKKHDLMMVRYVPLTEPGRDEE